MFWQEEEQTDLSTDQTQLAFQFNARQLPVDHIYALSRAIRSLLGKDWSDQIGIHEIHLAGSQNGWERPDPRLGQYLIPSRRARLLLRVPKSSRHQIEKKLTGQSIDLDGHELLIGSAKEKPIQAHDTLYARHVLSSEQEEESQLLKRIAALAAQQGIVIKKALCGKSSLIQTHAEPLFTRSLMIADLKPHHSLYLQQYGLGDGASIGCGLFIPMKGIRPIQTEDQ